MKIPTLLFCVLVFGSPSIHSQKRIVRDDLSVHVLVRVAHLSEDYLRFEYSFANSTGSRQVMERAIVELNDDWVKYGGSLRNVEPPKEKDWGEFPSVKEKMRWVTYYDTTGLDIMERPPRSAVRPGEELSFSFEARGLPGIGHFWAAGWVKWPLTMEEKDSLIREGYDWEKSRALDENFFEGLTVVRRSPPNPFVHLAFLDTLLSYTRQSAELGWLAPLTGLGKDPKGAARDNDCDGDERPENGIVRNIELRLQKTRRELERGDSVKARGELQKLVAKVERIWKRSEKEEERKHGKDRKNWWRRDKDEKVIMTSEAYALLKYNTEYVIDRLPERRRKPHRERD